MRRAAGPSQELRERSWMHPGHPHHPKTAGSRWPRPPAPPGPPDRPVRSGDRGAEPSDHLTPLPCVPKPPPARARCVTFEDEVVPPRGPPGRVRPAKEQEKQGDRSIPPRLSPRPRAVPDYVVRYPAIRSPRQREGYKGVFQDQLAEYVDLHRELRATCRPPGRTGNSRQDSAWLEKQQRCEYLKKKLTHLKARIQEYDRVTRSSAGGS
ncbi:occludin/ELL domain-containing protein 1 [Myiozetetes cayanensis]|uniref:occludin/ELL domain-containing protein 1 n=1 Tax=Myiozetetes cayanensis TaxID=478635 RepID=UPI00215F4B0C|nr:occludin/ELL domain-containing protein 1 [Myiozetetes cayanensis]